MSDLKYTVRNLKKEEVPMALDVWRETGMQEGINCLYTWLEVDPEAFKVAVTDEGTFYNNHYFFNTFFVGYLLIYFLLQC